MREALVRLGTVGSAVVGCLQTAELTLNLLIHFDDQLLVVVKSSQRLSEREQVLWAIVTLKRFRDRVLAALYAAMTEPSQSHGISFASEDRVQYPETTDPGDVVQDTVNLEIHLIKRFLHVQDMLCCHLDQTAAVSPERANGANGARRTEAGTQQTHRMEVLKPLAVGHVGLSAGNILYVLRVDQTHL